MSETVIHFLINYLFLSAVRQTNLVLFSVFYTRGCSTKGYLLHQSGYKPARDLWFCGFRDLNEQKEKSLTTLVIEMQLSPFYLGAQYSKGIKAPNLKIQS